MPPSQFSSVVIAFILATLCGCHAPQTTRREFPAAPSPITRYRAPSTREIKTLAHAARHGDAQAQFYLGWLHHVGLGVKQNNSIALKHLQASARHGSNEACLLLGIMYHRGEGVARDDVEAYKWLLLAVSPEQEDEITDYRERVASGLSDFQISEARRRAANLGHPDR